MKFYIAVRMLLRKRFFCRMNGEKMIRYSFISIFEIVIFLGIIYYSKNYIKIIKLLMVQKKKF